MDQPLLNNQFLTDILRKYENDESLKIDRFEISEGCEPGVSYTCDVTRILVVGTRKIGNQTGVYTSTFIVKRVPKNKQNAEWYRSNMALENENQAYNIVIPTLTKYSVGESLPIPDCIYASEDLVILEDLQPLDFHTIDMSEGGFTLQQCRAVIHALAKLHAASLVLAHKKPQAIHKLAKFMKDLMFEGGESQLMKNQKYYIDFAINAFNDMLHTPENEKALKLLMKLRKTVNTSVKELLTDPLPFSVIGHGDVWAGNVMFNSKGEVKLVDLQLMRYSSVAADLCYLFCVNLKPELWEENTDPLLEEYRIALQKNTKQMGVNLDEVLSREWLAHEMSRFAIYGLMRALRRITMFFYKNEGVDLSELTPEILNDTDAMLTKAGRGYILRMKQLVMNYVRHLN